MKCKIYLMILQLPEDINTILLKLTHQAKLENSKDILKMQTTYCSLKKKFKLTEFVTQPVLKVFVFNQYLM